MASLRQYVTNTQITQITDLVTGDITDKLINRAESMIDSYIADFYEGGLAKFNNSIFVFTSTQGTFTSTTLTLTTTSYSTNYFQYNVIEILEGSNKGLIIPVESSAGGVLTFTSVAGLTGQIACKTYQLGKFPMAKDCSTYKAIPRIVIEAVAYQVEFLVKNGKKTNKQTKKSESIGDNYSYTLGDTDTISNRISPIAMDLLDGAGYTLQTI